MVRGPLVDNMLIVGAVAAITFCALGRPAGTAVTLTLYLVLIVTGASSAWHHVVPYFSDAFGIPISRHPLAAVTLVVVAVGMWVRLGTSSRLATRLDP